MEQEEIIEKIRKSWNLPCIIVTKEGKNFIASPQEFIQDYLRYGAFNEDTFSAANGDDYMMLDILSDQINLSEIFHVISWPELKEYQKWIDAWEKH